MQHAMVMDGTWKRFQDQVLFTNLCKILQRRTKVEDHWRDDLRRAALLVGESVGTNDLLKSFIWNMAALETLLTKRDQEKTQDVLRKRAEALLGWVLFGEIEEDGGRKREVTLWEAADYESQLERCYRKRNSFLHGSERDDITEQDLAFTDLLLLNILANLVRFPKLFDSKDKVIAFYDVPQVRLRGRAAHRVRDARAGDDRG